MARRSETLTHANGRDFAAAATHVTMLRLLASVLCTIAVGCESAADPDAGMDAAVREDARVLECVSASDCANEEVCDPRSNECAADLPCTGHADCGGEAFCDGTSCARNETGGPCAEDLNCPSGESCIGGLCGCEGENFTAEIVPPNILIVLDRSDSMNDVLGVRTKWEVALEAIDALLLQYSSRVRFGLMLYPGTNDTCSEGIDCGPGRVFVDPGEDTAAAISEVLATAGRCNFRTPTAEALEVLDDYEGLEDPARANYVMLVTDGQSTCGDPVQATTRLRAEDPEIRTFAIGFGAAANPDELNAVAIAGGTARDVFPYYYQADSAEALTEAFGAIAGTVLSCAYQLDGVPEDLEQLYVYFDSEPVERDGEQGWEYDDGRNRLFFSGAACDALRSGTVESLVIVYGCPIF